MTMSQAFDEWMRRYTENPAEFEAEFQATSRYLKERGRKAVTSYGTACASYLRKLIREKRPKRSRTGKRQSKLQRRRRR